MADREEYLATVVGAGRRVTVALTARQAMAAVVVRARLVADTTQAVVAIRVRRAVDTPPAAEGDIHLVAAVDTPVVAATRAAVTTKAGDVLRIVSESVSTEATS